MPRPRIIAPVPLAPPPLGPDSRPGTPSAPQTPLIELSYFEQNIPYQPFTPSCAIERTNDGRDRHWITIVTGAVLGVLSGG
jgi:hypothetical protein